MLNYVVIPMKDRLELTRTLLRQLKEQGEYEAIILFDNGSDELTRRWLRSQDIAEVHDAKTANIHQMWNMGLNYAHVYANGEPHNVAILNNDLHIGPAFLSGLAEGLRSDPRMAVVCPNYDQRKGKGIQRVREICANRYDGTGGLAGFAFMLRGEDGYRFPEELNWWYGDNHMLYTLLRQGQEAGIVLSTHVKHVDGGGQTGDWFEDKILQAQVEQDKLWWQGFAMQEMRR
jgi:hypothetical protein